MAGFETVRQVALSFPGVEEAVTWGQPAFKVGGKMFACGAAHRSAEAGSLVVRVDLERRAELLAEAPETYYITEHYASYTGVLVRLAKVHPDALRGLLAGAIQFVAGIKPPKRPCAKASRPESPSRKTAGRRGPSPSRR